MLGACFRPPLYWQCRWPCFFSPLAHWSVSRGPQPPGLGRRVGVRPAQSQDDGIPRNGIVGGRLGLGFPIGCGADSGGDCCRSSLARVGGVRTHMKLPPPLLPWHWWYASIAPSCRCASPCRRPGRRHWSTIGRELCGGLPHVEGQALGRGLGSQLFPASLRALGLASPLNRLLPPRQCRTLYALVTPSVYA